MVRSYLASIGLRDVASHVWSDGRLYLYGGYVIPGDAFYCSLPEGVHALYLKFLGGAGRLIDVKGFSFR